MKDIILTIYTTDLDFANTTSTFNNKTLPKDRKNWKIFLINENSMFGCLLFFSFLNPGMYSQMMNDNYDVIHTVGIRSFQAFVCCSSI